MAIATKCQTPNAMYGVRINDQDIEAWVEFPFKLNIDALQAKLLEANIHNALELVLAPLFIGEPHKPFCHATGLGHPR